jgi:hypothetical protein
MPPRTPRKFTNKKEASNYIKYFNNKYRKNSPLPSAPSVWASNNYASAKNYIRNLNLRAKIVKSIVWGVPGYRTR